MIFFEKQYVNTMRTLLLSRSQILGHVLPAIVESCTLVSQVTRRRGGLWNAGDMHRGVFLL
jgi:hypothetical protein